MISRRLIASLFLAALCGWILIACCGGAAVAEENPSRPPKAATQPKRPTVPRLPAPAGKLDPRRLREVINLRRLALKHFKAEEYTQAAVAMRKILAISPASGPGWYNLACAHSRMANRPEAVACLTMAVHNGYASFRHMERDPDLVAIRSQPAYKALLARKDAIQRARAEKIVSALRAKFGEDYLYEIDHDRKMVFATNVDRRTLDELRKALTRYASAQWADLFTHSFEQYITIVVPKNWSAGRVGGYYNRVSRALVCKSVGMVLTHEFTHALHYADMDARGQRHPIWVAEGFATLFETSQVVRGHAVPQPNFRLNILQAIMRRKASVPWRDFFKLSQAGFMKKGPVGYPQTRYIMTYLHAKGLLKKWYDAYTESHDKDPTGAAAIAKVFGKDIADVESDWKKWVLAQKPVLLRLPAKHAYLGINLQGAKDGVRVLRTVPDSGAAKAGLTAGDVITKLNDTRIVDPQALLAVVAKAKVGQKINVEYRRGGEYKTAVVTLQAMPEKLATPRRGRAKPRPRPKKPAFRAGAAVVDITPTKFPVVVNGGFRERLAHKAHDPLHARCLVLADGTTTIALAAVDNCVIPRDLLDEAKRLAAKATGIPTGRMLISATHAHSCPSLAGVLGTGVQEDYARTLPKLIAEAIEKAHARLKPARVGWGVGKDPKNVFCRRFLMKPSTARTCDLTGKTGDRAQMNPGYQNPNSVRRTGPADDDVSILAVQTPQGRPIAVLGNYSTHYAGAPMLSADYFGVFCKRIGELIAAGEGFVGLMTNGTSGDANCCDFVNPRRKFTYVTVGNDVAAAAHAAYKKIKFHSWVPIAMAERKLTLKIRVPTADEVARAKAFLKTMRAMKRPKPQTVQEVYAHETVVLSQLPPTRELKLQAIRIGSLGITAMPNEVFGSTGLAIKKASPLKPTFNIELANGYDGYIPPPDQHALGGYTTWRARSSCLEEQAEPKIRTVVVELLQAVAKARPNDSK